MSEIMQKYKNYHYFLFFFVIFFLFTTIFDSLKSSRLFLLFLYICSFIFRKCSWSYYSVFMCSCFFIHFFLSSSVILSHYPLNFMNEMSTIFNFLLRHHDFYLKLLPILLFLQKHIQEVGLHRYKSRLAP